MPMDEEKPLSDCLALLPIGSIVQVASLDGKSLKYMARLIGVDSQKTIITEMPTTKQLNKQGSLTGSIFYPNRPLIMRALAEGVVYAFKSIIVHTYNGTSRFLITSYPTEIQSRQLRKESRLPCMLPGDILLENARCSGAISNISRGGCQFLLTRIEHKELLGKAKAEEKEVKMEIYFPFVDEPSLLKVTLRSITKTDDGRIAIGIAFNGEPASVKTFLDSLQLESITSVFE